ncbi:hypothetical protein [Nocardioides okcheonensis]|uniref:hypothetical protein n=1 Tax=Nocardioides okcheonensis TaxID=2894081 RepID=UPI001E569864|nr:hypothetical protein [Nocardioides okcheonensis]UFN42959.1 hypothetical protein LN652_12895 [Nocardioides okcheonensis]
MGHQPPKDVQEAAQRAVRWIEDGKAGKGFTDTGRRRATQLAGGSEVSDDVVRKMQAYFSRHEVDKDAEGFSRGGDGFPSPGRVAWDAWGGDPGERWVGTIDLDD